jgi:hypothetical protein
LKTPASLALSLFLSFGTAAVGRDWWASPAGSGEKDGSSPDNLADKKGIQKLLDQLEPSDRLLLSEGVYQNLTLTVKKSGTPDKPITILGQGDSRPIFESNWTIESPKKGPTAFLVEPGVSHVIFQDFVIRNYQHGIQARLDENAAPRSGLKFNNIDMQKIRHGFYLSGFSNLELIDCDLKSYSKHGFRFEQACSNVKMQNCTADCTAGDPEWEKKTEEFPFGFIVNDGGAPNTNFLFEDCASLNNMMPLQKTRYKNGDGFVVEGNSENVVFKRCSAVNNQDGGFDLKVKDVQLEDCIAFRNKRDFRIWATGRLTNCYAGWSQLGIWTKGGPVVADQCTVAGWKNAPVEAEDAAVGIELRKCILAADGTLKSAAQLKAVALIDCIETADLESAGLVRQSDQNSAFSSMPKDLSGFGSSKHSDKGFQPPRK